PAPVEQDGLEVLRAGGWRVRRSSASATLPLALALASRGLIPARRSSTTRLRTRQGRHTDRQCGRECDACPTEISSERHDHLPVSPSRGCAGENRDGTPASG